MKTLVIVQARMSSQRLPGKILMPLQKNLSLLECVVRRLARSDRAQSILVATSDQSSDQPVQQLCQRKAIAYFRGPLKNVALRYKLALEENPCDAFVRICADSPFIDPQIIDRAILELQARKVDLVTNTQRRSFPKGLSVQVMRTECFLRNYSKIVDRNEQEHVLSYFQNRTNQFRIHNFKSPKNYAQINLSVDTQDDANLALWIASSLGNKLITEGWQSILEMQQNFHSALPAATHEPTNAPS